MTTGTRFRDEPSTLMARRAVLDSFAQATAAVFDHLVSDSDFLGPERQPGVAVYHSPNVAVEVALDPRDGVLTLVSGQVGSHYFRAELSCLYVSAGLGPAQDVHRSARTTHQLSKSLESQSRALDRLLPLLTGTRREELLRACHGR